MAVEIADQRILLEGEPFPLLSGEVHYWHHDPSSWERILGEMESTGFTAISTSIPWAVHETGPGTFDFGQNDPHLDVGAFIDLSRKVGLKVIARPGPRVGGGIARFGIPRRVLENDEVLSRTSQDTIALLPVPPCAFPCPSYASEAFFQEITIWYEAVSRILETRLAPSGPVVAVQIDNEMAYHYRMAIYDQDYHRDSIALYRKWLDERYRRVANLNDEYGTSWQGFDEIEPPRSFDGQTPSDLIRHRDWVEFKEVYLITALRRLRKILEDQGIRGVLFTHNYPPSRVNMPPLHLPAAEKVVHIQGVDIYQPRRAYDLVKRNLLYLLGTSRLPMVPEFYCGTCPWLRPVDLVDQRFLVLAALMHGVKAINFYMAIDRDRWIGAPFSRTGERRDEEYRLVEDTLDLYKGMGLHRTRRRADCLLLVPRDYLRLEAATDLFDPLPPPILDDMGARSIDRCLEDRFGLPEAAQISPSREFESWYWALSVLGFPFALGDSESPPATWRKHRVLIVPTSSFLPASLEEALIDHVRSGGVLIIGPRLPQGELGREGSGQLLPLFGKDQASPGAERDASVALGKGRILRYGEPLLPATRNRLPVGLDTTVRRFLSLAGVSPLFPCVDDHVETAYHEGDGYGVLFAANPTEEPRRASIRFEGRLRFRQSGDDHPRTGQEGWSFDLGPYTVAAFQVFRE